MTEELISLDYKEIMNILPHRYPGLLVDRIVECKPGAYSKGYKNVSFNEPFFQGHFPENPIMPGVLQIEAMAQVGAPILYTLPEYKNKFALFAGIDRAKFKNIVRPGDRLDMEVILTKIKGPIAKSIGRATVDGKLCTEAEITIALIEELKQ